MSPFFTELFEYSHHYNQKLIIVFNENSDKTSEKAVKLINHILNAHHIWNNRIDAKQTSFSVWEIHTLKELTSIDQRNHEQTLDILKKVDLNQTINYTISSGTKFNNTVRDILFHIVNHSTYHRGQIATEFKQQGLEPLATDFILYKR